MTTGNDIHVELKEMNSELAHLPKEMPFDVPQNYFANFPTTITEMVLANELFEQQSANPFSVPPTYFNELPQKIQQKISSETIPTPSLFSSYPFYKPLQIAATLLLLVVGGLHFLSAPNNAITWQQQMNNLPEDAVQEYVAQYDEGQNLSNTTVTATLAFNSLSEDEIKQYLDEQGWQ